MDGRAFIINAYVNSCSPAMQALHEHACGWLQTVDGLSCSDNADSARNGLLSRADAARIADMGFRGDDVRKARKFAAEVL